MIPFLNFDFWLRTATYSLSKYKKDKPGSWSGFIFSSIINALNRPAPLFVAPHTFPGADLSARLAGSRRDARVTLFSLFEL